MFSVDDDDDESDYEHEHTLEDIELPDANSLKENDFVLIKFATKNTVVMYVGQVLSRTVYSDETIFEVKFMRREKPKSITFIFPIVEDISEVSFENVVGKLQNPVQHGGTARVARHLL